MSERQLQAGYAAWVNAEPFDKFQSAEWQDGWKSADDFAWWKRLAAELGATVTGFSNRYAGSLLFPNGQVHSLGGALLDAVARLASCDTHPKDGDVQQAPLGSGAVAVEDGQTPKGSRP